MTILQEDWREREEQIQQLKKEVKEEIAKKTASKFLNKIALLNKKNLESANTIKALQKALREQEQKLRKKEEIISKAEKQVKELTERLQESESLVAKLEKDKASLETELKECRNRLKSKQRELSDIEGVVERKSQKTLFLQKENEILKEELELLKESFRQEKATLYERLGTAFTQAKVYSLAIEAYTKSLSFNPDNPRAHYNLGLLYEHTWGDSKKALFHLRKYLRLNPDAENKEDVENLIRIIEGSE